jgi:carboxylesterase type B
MIFIPGGDYQYLGASLPVYNSERLVNTTNVIVAFVQYRLGEFNK